MGSLVNSSPRPLKRQFLALSRLVFGSGPPPSHSDAHLEFTSGVTESFICYNLPTGATCRRCVGSKYVGSYPALCPLSFIVDKGGGGGERARRGHLLFSFFFLQCLLRSGYLHPPRCLWLITPFFQMQSSGSKWDDFSAAALGKKRGERREERKKATARKEEPEEDERGWMEERGDFLSSAGRDLWSWARWRGEGGGLSVRGQR